MGFALEYRESFSSYALSDFANARGIIIRDFSGMSVLEFLWYETFEELSRVFMETRGAVFARVVEFYELRFG